MTTSVGGGGAPSGDGYLSNTTEVIAEKGDYATMQSGARNPQVIAEDGSPSTK